MNTMNKSGFGVGSIVVQYDYVCCREYTGKIVKITTEWSTNLDKEIDVATVSWECEVETRHTSDKFSSIAGRYEYLCE